MRQLLLFSLRKAGWAPLLVVATHLAISLLFDGYSHLPHLDMPMHLFGGAAIAFFFLTCLSAPGAETVLGVFTAAGKALFVLSLTAFAAVGWEFTEWFSDRYLGTHAQVGLEDTLLDLLLGVVGGALLLLFRGLTVSR